MDLKREIQPRDINLVANYKQKQNFKIQLHSYYKTVHKYGKWMHS